MAAEFKFEYSPRYPIPVKTDQDLLVRCELEILSKEEHSVTFTIHRQEDDSEIDPKSLELGDRALISDRAWTPPQKAIDEAWDHYEESFQPKYNKYEEVL